MGLLRRFSIRTRYLLTYSAVLFAGSVVLGFVFPEQRLGIAVTVLVGLLSIWLVGRLIARDLRYKVRRLREMTDAVGRGDLSGRIERLPDEDFIKLAGSLDRMAAQLQQTLQEREQLQQKLTRSEKLALIGELAATVAHEINNPLDGLQNSTRIIRRNLENTDQVRQLLEMMEAGLYRIETIVRRLLTMSRDEPVNLVPTRMDEMVNDAVVFVQPRLERCGIELVRRFPRTPIMVNADRVQFAQALINLMINAADAMPDGGTLTLECGPGDDDEQVLLDIADTGRGIDPEHLPHIFDPFYTTKGKGKGTGLGLSVVARIVEAHRGKIDLTSRAGKGTQFHIALPAVAQDVKKVGAVKM
ncbi:MAG: sensor histidine kinase [Planctomycetota bacterium]|jgi:signal transduction histidine kinase